jgi:hypothetical protein
MSEIPASIQNITPTCRANRGSMVALQVALQRITETYWKYAGVPENENVTWRISLVRVEAAQPNPSEKE